MLVELVGEHHPAGQGRRQDRGGDRLVGLARDGEDPRGVLVLVERGQHARRRGLDPASVGRGGRAVHPDDIGPVGAQAAGQVAEGRADGRGVLAGDRLAEAEIAGQQGGAFLQLLRAQRPDAVEHRRRGGQFVADGPLRLAGAHREEGCGEQQQARAEQARIEHGELGSEVAEHGTSRCCGGRAGI